MDRLEGWRDGASEAEYFLTGERALCLGTWACVSARVAVSACVHLDVCVGVYIRAYECIRKCVAACAPSQGRHR